MRLVRSTDRHPHPYRRHPRGVRLVSSIPVTVASLTVANEIWEEQFDIYFSDRKRGKGLPAMVRGPVRVMISAAASGPDDNRGRCAR